MKEQAKFFWQSPCGWLEMTSSGDCLKTLKFCDLTTQNKQLTNYQLIIVKQLNAYFRGVLTVFDIDYRPTGSDFEKAVWQEILRIPYGEMVSYRDIAISLGDAKKARAVGNASAKNKILLIIPCHRVTKSNGELGNYGAGQAIKKALLDHEHEHR